MAKKGNLTRKRAEHRIVATSVGDAIRAAAKAAGMDMKEVNAGMVDHINPNGMTQTQMGDIVDSNPSRYFISNRGILLEKGTDSEGLETVKAIGWPMKSISDGVTRLDGKKADTSLEALQAAYWAEMKLVEGRPKD